jgi:hypothetical protein
VGGSQPEDSEEDQSLAGDAAAQPLLRRQEDSAGGSSIRRTHMAPGRQQGTTGQAVSNAQGRRSPSLANGVTVSGARRAALALQRSAAQMPAARVAELHSLIWASLGRQPTEGGYLCSVKPASTNCCSVVTQSQRHVQSAGTGTFCATSNGMHACRCSMSVHSCKGQI